jgi:hypothetical protein
LAFLVSSVPSEVKSFSLRRVPHLSLTMPWVPHPFALFAKGWVKIFLSSHIRFVRETASTP